MHLKNFSQRGSVTVWLVGLISLFVVIALFFVNVFLIVDAKISMQAAIDRGVYAGAGYLAHVMNEVARRNRSFRNEYLKKESSFHEHSMPNVDWIKKQVDELNHNHAVLAEEMSDLLEAGYENAHKVAEEVTNVNLENVGYFSDINYSVESGAGKMFEVIDEYEDGEILNKEKIEPIEIVGTDYDPEEYEEYLYIVRKYLVKSPDDYVAISGSVNADFKPPFLPDFFASEDGVRLGAISAAQPYGGSIKEFAFEDSDDESSEEDSYLYNPEFIPVGLLKEDADVDH